MYPSIFAVPLTLLQSGTFLLSKTYIFFGHICAVANANDNKIATFFIIQKKATKFPKTALAPHSTVKFYKSDPH